MERVAEQEVRQESHFLEGPLQALLEEGHVVFGQDDKQYAAIQQAAVFLNNQDKQVRESLTDHPLMAEFMHKIEAERNKEGFDLARIGWERALTLVGAAMLVPNDHIKELLEAIQVKYTGGSHVR